MRERFILLVPLTFNDGSRVPEDVLRAIEADMFLLGGGYTMAGSVTGAYRMADGTKQVESLAEYWIAVEEDSFPQLESMVQKFCALLGQECMYLERTGGAVKFIGPKPAEDESS